MKKTALSFAIAAAMTTSVALADGPVPLTDAQLDNVTAGGFGVVNVLIDIEKFKTIDISKVLTAFEVVDYEVIGNGYLGYAEADANCSSFTDCKSETHSFTDVNLERFFGELGLPNVTSHSESLAAAPSLSGLIGATAP